MTFTPQHVIDAVLDESQKQTRTPITVDPTLLVLDWDTARRKRKRLLEEADRLNAVTAGQCRTAESLPYIERQSYDDDPTGLEAWPWSRVVALGVISVAAWIGILMWIAGMAG
ncbi:hypothetical protein ATO8_09121 [Roseivivax marinus]|uniref:Uncharacterized protein n=1 Tax=Roseivivax marinus TaxID=1379903 RepID=W4HKW3_9RHOB|nr:hypothetical protein [Roseivivax marinus]ETW13362.1 hypothetical protein ATO8_09121 [Roseivivax marinus]